jgi:hypothetical protein
VGVQYATIIEMEQLMFAATLDARDPRARKRLQLRRRESALQCGVQ